MKKTILCLISLSLIGITIALRTCETNKPTEFTSGNPASTITNIIDSGLSPAPVDQSDPILKIVLKDGKEIVINFDSGRVTHKGVSLDRASAEFWDHAVLQYPQFKKRIIKNYLEAQSKTVK